MEQEKNLVVDEESNEKLETHLTVEIPTEIQAGMVCECKTCCSPCPPIPPGS
jgi:hypothetical protein